MNSRYWHLGFPPTSSAEWMAYRADQHEAFLDRMDTLDHQTDYVVELPQPEPEEPDPVTPNDLALWSAQAQWARRDFEDTIWHRSWDEIVAYWDEMRAEVNAKAFVKRFEAWCEKGCPLDTQEGNQ